MDNTFTYILIRNTTVALLIFDVRISVVFSYPSTIITGLLKTALLNCTISVPDFAIDLCFELIPL